MKDLISRQAAIDTLHMDTSIIPYKKAREYADATISEIRNRLEKLPPAEPDVPDTNVGDLISRAAAISLPVKPKEDRYFQTQNLDDAYDYGWYALQRCIEMLPPAQTEPSEITDEQAILHLQLTGWMQNHDREMYKSGLREQLADDSGSYDSLISCEDTISRAAAIDVLEKLSANYTGVGKREWHPHVRECQYEIQHMPSAQLEPSGEYARGYNDAKREIALSGEYERAYQRGKADAQPEPKQGRWIEDAEAYYKAVNEKGGGVNGDTPFFTDDIACSECLALFSVIDNEAERFDYCPNCGADMRGEQE